MVRAGPPVLLFFFFDLGTDPLWLQAAVRVVELFRLEQNHSQSPYSYPELSNNGRGPPVCPHLYRDFVLTPLPVRIYRDDLEWVPPIRRAMHLLVPCALQHLGGGRTSASSSHHQGGPIWHAVPLHHPISFPS